MYKKSFSHCVIHQVFDKGKLYDWVDINGHKYFIFHPYIHGTNKELSIYFQLYEVEERGNVKRLWKLYGSDIWKALKGTFHPTKLFQVVEKKEKNFPHLLFCDLACSHNYITIYEDFHSAEAKDSDKEMNTVQKIVEAETFGVRWRRPHRRRFGN